MRDLVRNCLRMRPERIIVGEVRGPEAFDLLQAMNTGHDGSMGTLHASMPREALSRLESMITMGGYALPSRTIREMIVGSIDVVIQAARHHGHAQDDRFRLLGPLMLRSLEQFIDAQFLTMLFAAIAAGATVLTLAMPLLARDTLSMRMKAVAFEREKIRQRERERLAQGSKITLRQSPKAYMNTVVRSFNLWKWVGEEKARQLLVQAGCRGHAPYVTYLFFRIVMPIAMLLLALFYVFVVIRLDQPTLIKLGIGIGAAYFGMLCPNLYLKNKIQLRQTSIKRAFPDALDLLLICMESGMSVEAAFQRVSDEVGAQSIQLAEELTLTTAELSCLPDRRQAYDNLVQRVGLEGVKAVCLALQQAERYGTPLGTTMRVLAQENRDMRMSGRKRKPPPCRRSTRPTARPGRF